tara:strand:+ start:6326 stop:6973 length:648 start_codon:yes stop_codon:yes gene_type:complete
MATSAGAYGFIPVKNADGSAYVGARNQYEINPSGISENIGYGTIVQLHTDGYVTTADGDGSDATTNNLGGNTIGALGVFVGCEYVNSVGQLVFDQLYPSGQAAATGTLIKAYVVDDPNVVFQVQANGAVTQTDLGHNVHLAGAGSSGAQHITNDVNTTTGKSKVAVDATTQTATAAFKIVGFSDRPGSTIGDDFTDLLVKFNLPYHQFGTGVVSN